MKIKDKITKQNGSALMLAIVLMTLFLIVLPIIMNQINNQIKSNEKVYTEAKYKYKAEGNIEESISTIFVKVQSFIDEVKSTYKDSKKEIINKEIEITGIGKVNISANINLDKTNGNKINSFNLGSLNEGVELASVIDDKYEVKMKVKFNVDNNFILGYEIISYSKGPK